MEVVVEASEEAKNLGVCLVEIKKEVAAQWAVEEEEGPLDLVEVEGGDEMIYKSIRKSIIFIQRFL